MSLLARVTSPHLSMEIARGDVILLRGPNGSGKTSLLRALAGLPSAMPFSVEAPRAGLAPQDARDAIVGLTVRGEFRLRARPLPERFRPIAHRPATALSSGETRAIALEAAEGHELLLLDEPNEGLDEVARASLRALVMRQRAHGAVVLADHGRAFDDLATRVVSLGEHAHAPLPPMPRGQGAVVLAAPEMRNQTVTLPALALRPGFHALLGANGSGKSTLLRRLAGLASAEGVRIAGAPPRPGENVALLLPHARDLLTRERVADECPPHALVPATLRERHPLTLSGGEAQRVALAKTLSRDVSVLLLDEPEAHLDAEGRALLAESIADRVKRGACVLAATHDETLAALAQSEVRL